MEFAAENVKRALFLRESRPRPQLRAVEVEQPHPDLDKLLIQGLLVC